jgi:hypothetical protein
VIRAIATIGCLIKIRVTVSSNFLVSKVYKAGFIFVAVKQSGKIKAIGLLLGSRDSFKALVLKAL